MTRTVLHVGTFGGASAFPLRVAVLQGRFAAAGLDVELEQTTDSGALRSGLAEGRLGVVHLAPDNVIAWRDGTATLPAIPVRAWLAGSNGPITLVAGSARSVKELRGARIGVDAPGSGFAPILRRILAGGGLAEEDVELVALGATRRRAEALREGAIDATMLTLPWSRLAVEAGAVAIADHGAVAPGLLTSCGASLDGWLAAGGGALARAYAGAVEEAVAWLRQPASRSQAIAWLAQDVGIGEVTATAVLDVMLDPALGWPLVAAPASGALDAVWRLRAEAVGEPAAPAETYLGTFP